jgi:hypothetical protein
MQPQSDRAESSPGSTSDNLKSQINGTIRAAVGELRSSSTLSVRLLCLAIASGTPKSMHGTVRAESSG